MSAGNENSIHSLVRILSEQGPMRAGDLGFELWGTKAQRCKCENLQATMFIRPATRMLYRAQSAGLVRWREHGKSRLWYANAEHQARAVASRPECGCSQSEVRHG